MAQHLVLNVQPAASLAGLLILLLKVLIPLLAVARIDGVVRLIQIISPKNLIKRGIFFFSAPTPPSPSLKATAEAEGSIWSDLRGRRRKRRKTGRGHCRITPNSSKIICGNTWHNFHIRGKIIEKHKLPHLEDSVPEAAFAVSRRGGRRKSLPFWTNQGQKSPSFNWKCPSL